MTEDRKRFREIDHKEMGRRIRERREYLQMNRDKLAEHLDVSPQFIADVEYGNKGVSIKSLYILSQELDVTADYILAGSVYELETNPEATKVGEEIRGIVQRCNARQLKGLKEIAEIYVDGIKEDE